MAKKQASRMITRDDLDRAVVSIKEHVDLTVAPIRDRVNDHETILRGETKKNGLVGDVNQIKTTHKYVKWAVGGGLTGVFAFLKTLFFPE